MSQFGFTILGSGSSGNAAVIHAPDGNILLDAGFSAKELERRMILREIAPDGIRAILLTHEHSDHVKGCRVFAQKHDIPVFLTAMTCNSLRSKKALPERLVLMTPGAPFELCGLRLEPFSISHDVDAVAFRFIFQNATLGFATDLGCLNHLAINKLHGCNALVIEANHDSAMLRNSSRPLQLKRRILGRMGHLSNDAVMDSLDSLLTNLTHELVFAHLSDECNNAKLLETIAVERLAKLNRSDILPKIAGPLDPMETVWLS